MGRTLVFGHKNPDTDSICSAIAYADLKAQCGADVFNALDIMENDPSLLKDLKFGPGDGHLQYYLYNWQCPEVEPREVGLVLH